MPIDKYSISILSYFFCFLSINILLHFSNIFSSSNSVAKALPIVIRPFILIFLKFNALDKIVSISEAHMPPFCISLIAVSKTIDIDTLKKVHKLGINDFGENKPQELRDKIPEIPDASWHMIGRLQSNKIKYVVGKTKLIQSVDSIELMEKINDCALKINVIQDILIENGLVTDKEIAQKIKTKKELYEDVKNKIEKLSREQREELIKELEGRCMWKK